MPADPFPETETVLIVIKDEEVAFLNIMLAQCRQTGIDEAACDAPVATVGGNGQMMNVAAPAVMTGKYGPDHLSAVFGYKTHLRIAFKVRLDAGRGIGLA